MSRNLVFGFTSSKRHLLLSLFNALELQKHCWSISANCCVKKTLNVKLYIFHDQWEKFIKQLTEMSFNVLGGNPLKPLSTLKLFSPTKCFITFLLHNKNTFLMISRFLHNNLLILFNDVLCNSKALNNDGNKWLFLNVNPKTRFLDV